MEKLFNIYFHGNRDAKQIALTFDDGPSKETLEILKILKKFNAKATFFVLGERIKGREKIIKKIIKGGHEIGNHSFHHPKLWFKSKKFIEKEIIKTDKELDKFGVETNLFRPPPFLIGFNLLRACKKLNKKIIGADLIPKDYKKQKIENLVKKVLNKIKNGSIIDFHDYAKGIGRNPNIVPALRKIIPELKKRKYKLITISELFNFS